jgi:hypothetical protein
MKSKSHGLLAVVDRQSTVHDMMQHSHHGPFKGLFGQARAPSAIHNCSGVSPKCQFSTHDVVRHHVCDDSLNLLLSDNNTVCMPVWKGNCPCIERAITVSCTNHRLEVWQWLLLHCREHSQPHSHHVLRLQLEVNILNSVSASGLMTTNSVSTMTTNTVTRAAAFGTISKGLRSFAWMRYRVERLCS